MRLLEDRVHQQAVLGVVASELPRLLTVERRISRIRSSDFSIRFPRPRLASDRLEPKSSKLRWRS
jgi:hypothetical protein